MKRPLRRALLASASFLLVAHVALSAPVTLEPMVRARHAGAHDQTGADHGQPEAFRALQRLTGEAEDRAVVSHDHAIRVLVGRHALEMEDLTGRLEGDRPTRPPSPRWD